MSLDPVAMRCAALSEIMRGYAESVVEPTQAQACEIGKMLLAFAKMLEALERCVHEAVSEDHEPREALLHVRDVSRDALRAAREALGLPTPPQRCTDTVTAWLDEGDQTVEQTNTCGHVLPCPLHTPRAAREAVKP